MKKIYKLIISLLIPQAAGGIGSIFTAGSVKDWYPVLEKPALEQAMAALDRKLGDAVPVGCRTGAYWLKQRGGILGSPIIFGPGVQG